MENHSVLGLYPRFLVDVFEDVKKLNFKFSLEHQNGSNNKVNHYKQKNSFDGFKSIAMLSFHKIYPEK